MRRRTAIALAPAAFLRASEPVQQWIEYSSSIDPLPALKALVAKPLSARNLPVLVVMHGFRESVTSFPPDVYRRMASAGTFVVAVEMRGRNGSSGTPDCSGREIQDIVDATHFVLKKYPKETDSSQIHVVGYSGGGGNALLCAARYPDFFNTVTSFFGISDYEAWSHEASPARLEVLRRWMGNQSYESRSARKSITNYRGGKLRLYHDSEDDAVPVSHSETIAQALPNAELHVSKPGDALRWLHGAPAGKSHNIETEKQWLADVAAKRIFHWTIPHQGNFAVPGYLTTREFNLWIGEGTQALGALTYDLRRTRFEVTSSHVGLPWKMKLRNGREIGGFTLPSPR